MRRPTVLHCARDWIRPSEGFVAGLVAGCSATRAAVAAEQRWPDAPWVDANVHALDSRVRRVPARFRGGALSGWVAACAARERASLLHLHFGYWAPVVAPAAAVTGLPWVVSLHGHDLLVEAARDPAQCRRLARADAIVVPSSFLADRASDLGLPSDRIRVVPSGVDLAQVPFRERHLPVDGPPTVVFAGRFVEKKGVLDVAAALDLVAASSAAPAFRAVFVGSGPLQADLEVRLATVSYAWELRDGSAPGAVAAALAAADVVVTGSRPAADGDDETLGLVNLEALAAGAPLVTTRTGGIPEAVGGAADLVDPGDVVGLARAVGDLLAEPRAWAVRGRAGRAHVAARYERGARVADVEALYAAVMAHRPLPVPASAPVQRPPVSVVIVTRDRRELLRSALDAVLTQSYPADLVQVAVVDNGSTDGSGDDLRRRATDDARLVLVDPAPDLSVAAARNRAVAATTGTIVAFTDDDCRPVDTWLESLVAGFRDDVGLVQGTTGPPPGVPLRPLSRTQFTASEYGLYETCNIAYRREVFDRAGGFDVTFADDIAAHLGGRFGRYPFGEDTDLAWRARRAGARTAFSATAVVHHHVFPPSTRLLLRRAWIGAAWPLLVARTPELRERFLTGRVFLGRRRAFLVLGAALSVAAAGAGPRARPVLTATAAVPYLLEVVRPRRPGVRDRLRALPVTVVVDLAQTAALGYGSVRARSLVL